MSEHDESNQDWTEDFDTDWDKLEDSSDEVVVGDPETDVIFTTDEGVEVNLSRPLLTVDQARELTNHIRSTADTLYVLIARAHAGRAWEALGYKSFEGYVTEEFDMSRSRAYQLLNQAKIVEAITAAAPEGTEVHITEAVARDLKSIISEVTGEVEEKTKGLDPDDAGAVIEELIRAERERKNSTTDETGFSLDEELAADQADRDGFADSSFGHGNGGAYDGPRFGDAEDNELEDLGLEDMDDILTFDEDPQEVRRNYDAVYVLYTVLGMMKDLPPVEGVITMVPAERRVQVETSIEAPVKWLNDFCEQWKAQEWRNELTQDAPSEEITEDLESSDPSQEFASDPEVDDIFADFDNQ